MMAGHPDNAAESNLAPLAPSGDGRTVGGRFAPGNAHGRGNPHARQAAELREVLMAAVTADDMRVVVGALVEQARAGNVPAARELLDRVLGRVPLAATVDVSAGMCMACTIRQHYHPTAPIDAV